MREPKYQAWDKEDSEMLLDPTRNILLAFWDEPERFELREYTGLKDKNGVEIYEGDIVAVFPEGLYDDKRTGKIEFEDGMFVAKEAIKQMGENDWWSIETYECHDHYSRELARAKEIEVIGNIYENKELLEKE